MGRHWAERRRLAAISEETPCNTADSLVSNACTCVPQARLVLAIAKAWKLPASRASPPAAPGVSACPMPILRSSASSERSRPEATVQGRHVPANRSSWPPPARYWPPLQTPGQRFFGRAQVVKKLPFRAPERQTKRGPQRRLDCSGLRREAVCLFYTHGAKVGFDEARPMHHGTHREFKVGTNMSLSMAINVLAQLTNAASIFPAPVAVCCEQTGCFVVDSSIW